MAKTMYSAMALLFVFNLLIGSTLAGRNLHDVDAKNPDDIKHPEKFFFHDRGYLIPGVGRGIKPKSKKGFNPFTYNPITGSNNGFPGVSIPSVGGSGGRNYVPGGDDTLVPNPSVEVPNPAGGIGNTPVDTTNP
ncbi:putative cell wall protein [Bidens hawaiensis]|uniref:putative cell wall protein n=1 Tax=Bidens hawaiensis TaxID=980011 RepID=UPI00404A94D1